MKKFNKKLLITTKILHKMDFFIFCISQKLKKKTINHKNSKEKISYFLFFGFSSQF